MDITIRPTQLHGTVAAIASKSLAHRYLICAAFSDQPTEIYCRESSRDIEVTVNCLRNLGVQIDPWDKGYRVIPTNTYPKQASLHCEESGSSLRFFLPIIGALGIDTTFTMTGRLSKRPLNPLLAEMSRMGCQVNWLGEHTLHCCGKLHPGKYTIAGNVSSQFVTGLLFACALMGGGSHLVIDGALESKPYVDMTMAALSSFGVDVSCPVNKAADFHSPGRIVIEGDWTGSAAFFVANTLGSSVHVTGLNPASCQGDRIVDDLLNQLEEHCTIDVSNCPDLVPVLAVAAAAKQGALFQSTRRLRLKESDRVFTIVSMLNAFGCSAVEGENSLAVYPGKFRSTTVNSYGDHRIAMAAAIAAICADGPVTILDAHCVEKSYPGFWADYKKLGGIYEQHIR